MSLLGRGRPFKPALPIISNEWYAYLQPRVTTATAGVAVAVGQAPPQTFSFRADACCNAYNITGIAAVVSGTAAAIGAAYNYTRIGVGAAVGAANSAAGITTVNVGIASATSTANNVMTYTVAATATAAGTANNGNTNNPIYWTTPSATIAWTSGEDIDWAYQT